MKVLISEDDQMLWIIYKKIFSGDDVTFCLNGDDTIRKSTEIEFDILIQDIGLPDMPGYDVSLQILNNLKWPKRKLSIAIVSAHLNACLCQDDTHKIEDHPSTQVFSIISKGELNFIEQMREFRNLVFNYHNLKKLSYQ